MDLIPYFDLDVDTIQKSILQIHPDLPVFNISAETGEGVKSWVDWLKAKLEKKI